VRFANPKLTYTPDFYSGPVKPSTCGPCDSYESAKCNQVLLPLSITNAIARSQWANPEGGRSMKPVLGEHAFASLLDRLANDHQQSGERYEELRRVLTRFFEWRSIPFPEDRTDDTLDRVARKLSEGVQIQNINAYCYEVARLVSLEALKAPALREIQIENEYVDIASDSNDDALEKEVHLACLESCLDGLPVGARELIIEYYQDEKRGKIDRRKALANRLGLKREALANRAQRLRDKLEHCVINCVRKKLPI
jgi:DNA-directed RNA polymerase specialized sigma24 family protein